MIDPQKETKKNRADNGEDRIESHVYCLVFPEIKNVRSLTV